MQIEIPAIPASADARRFCGYIGRSPMLVIGRDADHFVRSAMLQGAHVLHADGIPDGLEGIFCGTIVVPVTGLAETGLGEMAEALSYGRFDTLFLLCEKRAAGDFERDAIERQFFAHGFAKHFSYYDHFDYNRPGRTGELLVVALRRLPDTLHEVFTHADLIGERDLHMDMSREPGRRSDGHVYRYHLASDFIRPGDTVLDCACGYGYGSALMARRTGAKSVTGVDLSDRSIAYATLAHANAKTGFRQGDATDLSFIEDNSVDTFVTFETLEHIPLPLDLLKEAYRVLRPGGRIILSVPDDWSDETGEDPNPYHFHVYTLERLNREMEGLFHIETVLSQNAGGGYKHPDAPLSSRPYDEKGEWILAVGMKWSAEAADTPYVETVYPYSFPPRHALAFARDYHNPWLARALVAPGTRMSDRAARKKMLEAELAPAGTPDESAIHCCAGYLLLEEGPSDTDVMRWNDRREDILLGAADLPHNRRWRVSLDFLAGRLLQSVGRSSESEACFVSAMDASGLEFSPSLATKIVEAAFQAGLAAYARDDTALARERWMSGLHAFEIAKSAPMSELVGKYEEPISFLLPEFLEATDCAIRCANALAATAPSSSIDDGCQRLRFLETPLMRLKSDKEALDREIARQHVRAASLRKSLRLDTPAVRLALGIYASAPVRRLRRLARWILRPIL